MKNEREGKNMLSLIRLIRNCDSKSSIDKKGRKKKAKWIFFINFNNNSIKYTHILT